MRGKVNLSREDGIARFGIPALDELNRKWQVEEIAPLWRHPTADPIAQRYGCDLQFLIQFNVNQDIQPVADDYEKTARGGTCLPERLYAL